MRAHKYKVMLYDFVYQYMHEDRRVTTVAAHVHLDIRQDSWIQQSPQLVFVASKARHHPRHKTAPVLTPGAG